MPKKKKLSNSDLAKRARRLLDARRKRQAVIAATAARADAITPYWSDTQKKKLTRVYDSRSPSQPPSVSIKDYRAQMKKIRKRLLKQNREADKRAKQRKKRSPSLSAKESRILREQFLEYRRGADERAKRQKKKREWVHDTFKGTHAKKKKELHKARRLLGGGDDDLLYLGNKHTKKKRYCLVDW